MNHRLLTPITHADLDPELRRAFRHVSRDPILPETIASVRHLVQRFQRARVVEGVHVENLDAPSVRLYNPEHLEPTAALLWVHGGGLIVGLPEQDDTWCSDTALTLGILVVSVRYRLAPEHPYPAAIDDCFMVWNWLVHHSLDLGIDPDLMAIGGESAGGGLAAVLAHRVRDLGGPQPAGQLLVTPMLDDRTAASRELDAMAHPVWDNISNRTAWSAYLGGPRHGALLPRHAAAARREDLSRLPPAWLGVGSLDLFHREGLEYAARLEASGVECQLEDVTGAAHRFTALAPRATVTREFIASQRAFLRERLRIP